MSDERYLKDRVRRFTAKVDRRGRDDCWEWLASRDSRGYGWFRVGSRSIRAHRVSWELHFGEIPDGKLVLHRCNNPSCVNPYHLYLGSRSDNMRDAVQAGLHRKVNNEDVKEIQRLLASGESQRSIAKLFGVCQYVIFSIVKGTPSYVRKTLG